jgi:hypothetical protein
MTLHLSQIFFTDARTFINLLPVASFQQPADFGCRRNNVSGTFAAGS